MKISICLVIMCLIAGSVKVSGQELRIKKEKFNRKNLKSEFYTLKNDKKIRHGPYKSYWYGNIIRESGQFYENLKDGEWIIHDNRGNVVEIQYFDKGNKSGIWQKLVESGQVVKRYDQSQGIELEPYFNIRCHYPALAREYEIEGIMKISYEVDENCDLREIGIAKSLSKEYDESAIEGTKRLLGLMKKYNSPTCDTLRNIIEVKFRIR